MQNILKLVESIQWIYTTILTNLLDNAIEAWKKMFARN